MKVTVGRVFNGMAGLAYEVLPELEESDPPDKAATVAKWFLDCPRQSPAWRHYGLAIIHLRPIEGVKPANIHVPGATHEVMLLAYDPRVKPEPTKPETWRFMTPLNFVDQLELPDDRAAKNLLESAAMAVVQGVLWAEPPLSGMVEPWRTVMLKTAAHARGEKHAP